MDLEHLTKHQIVLLTLLVSFVTSIATGIVTVSLMNQAPPSVTRTINQIVERTVQTVVPQSMQNANVASAQSTPNPIVLHAGATNLEVILPSGEHLPVFLSSTTQTAGTGTSSPAAHHETASTTPTLQKASETKPLLKT